MTPRGEKRGAADLGSLAGMTPRGEKRGAADLGSLAGMLFTHTHSSVADEREPCVSMNKGPSERACIERGQSFEH